MQLTLVAYSLPYFVYPLVRPSEISGEMTTSSANNLVFRGFFEKQKLTGPNFIDWFRQLRIVLSIEDKLNYLEHPLPPAPVAPAGQQVAPEILETHTAWVKGSKEIAGLLLMTMDSKIQRNLENLHANDMLKELKTPFAQQAEKTGRSIDLKPKNGITFDKSKIECLKLFVQGNPEEDLKDYAIIDSGCSGSMTGDNHDRRSTSGGCQYLGRRLVSWQCKKQTIVAISSTEAEYVAAAL
ncbi:zinc finger, CCHC-type containing protein [Tanacetum coccineum]|uniref:Zinc finger, CCHC-type containing protein n=1 Tax=Tanacetum coccineum TaxID=301880 RepID=A0ABQ4WZS9_9ASTR